MSSNPTKQLDRTEEIEIPCDSEWDSAYIVTAGEALDVLNSSHLMCTWEVSRKGRAEPCEREAVAIRFDEMNGGIAEVCKRHTSRAMVPLSFIAKVAFGGSGE